MKYRVVFEYQGEDSAMSDVYNFSDEGPAYDKFAELRDSLMHAVDPNCSEVIDEPMNYSVVNRTEGIFGCVRLLTDEKDRAMI